MIAVRSGWKQSLYLPSPQRHTKKPNRPGIVEKWEVWAIGVALFTTEKMGWSCKNAHSSQESWWVDRGNHSTGFILFFILFFLWEFLERLYAHQPASMSLFYFFLALHESRKPSTTQKVRSWLMRNECYLPALMTSVMHYVLELLTGANADTCWMFSDAFQNTENTVVGPLAPGQAENTFCAPMHVNKGLS